MAVCTLKTTELFKNGKSFKKTRDILFKKYKIKSYYNDDIVVLCNAIRNNVKHKINRECNGLVLSMRTYEPLMICSRTLRYFVQNNYLVNGFIKSNDYAIYKIKDGTSFGMYYWNGEWVISTTSGYDMNSNMPNGNLTYQEIISECLKTSDLTWDTFTSGLDRKCCYNFGFKHHSMHKFNDGNNSIWFIQSTDLTDYTTVDVAEVSAEVDVKPDTKPDVKPDTKPDVKPDTKPDTKKWADINSDSDSNDSSNDKKPCKWADVVKPGTTNPDIKPEPNPEPKPEDSVQPKPDEPILSASAGQSPFVTIPTNEPVRIKNIQQAYANSTTELDRYCNDKSDVYYGIILRSKNEDVTGEYSDICIESSLLKKIKYILYNSKIHKICNDKKYDKDLYTELSAYLDDELYEYYTILFPNNKFDVIREKIYLIVDYLAGDTKELKDNEKQIADTIREQFKKRNSYDMIDKSSSTIKRVYYEFVIRSNFTELLYGLF